MKTAFAALLAICVLALSLPCPAQDEEDIPSLAKHLMEQRTGDLPDMEKNRVIRVLTVMSLTNYYFLSGEVRGFEHTLLKDFETSLSRGRSNRDPGPKVLFLPMPQEQLIPALLSGKGDIVAAGLTVTPERAVLADFTDPYVTGVDEVVVSHVSTRPVLAAQDLSGRTVFAQSASSYLESLKALDARLAAEGRAPVRTTEASPYLTPEDILEIVSAGAVERTVMDSHVAGLWSKVLPGLRVDSGAVLRRGASLAWMVRKDSPLLKARLNAFLSTHHKGTRLGDAAFRKVFENTEWIHNPLAGEERARFVKYMPLFKKYAAMYNLDWRLLACQAYRESRLNPEARSPAGYIGFFQLDPALADNPRIGIKNLHLPENNVHAGAKYLALIRDTYFKDPALSTDEGLRYALAAYNAGAGRVSKARLSAGKLGFDPDVWFGQGEMATLRLVGDDPVRYVSAINKYFAVYSMMEMFDRKKDQERERMGVDKVRTGAGASGKAGGR